MSCCNPDSTNTLRFILSVQNWIFSTAYGWIKLIIHPEIARSCFLLYSRKFLMLVHGIDFHLYIPHTFVLETFCKTVLHMLGHSLLKTLENDKRLSISLKVFCKPVQEDCFNVLGTNSLLKKVLFPEKRLNFSTFFYCSTQKKIFSSTLFFFFFFYIYDTCVI